MLVKQRVWTDKNFLFVQGNRPLFRFKDRRAARNAALKDGKGGGEDR